MLRLEKLQNRLCKTFSRKDKKINSKTHKVENKGKNLGLQELSKAISKANRCKEQIQWAVG